MSVLAGRQHTYEDGRADAMKGAIRTLAALGVQTLLLTNAAGSLAPAAGTGSLMRSSRGSPMRSTVLTVMGVF